MAEETRKATTKFNIMPIKPIPSGEMDINQFSEVFNSTKRNLKKIDKPSNLVKLNADYAQTKYGIDKTYNTYIYRE